jgi:hypothetical protein
LKDEFIALLLLTIFFLQSYHPSTHINPRLRLGLIWVSREDTLANMEKGDVASFRLFKPVRSEPLHENNRKFLHILFANKGIDAINISNILNRKEVVTEIPPYSSIIILKLCFQLMCWGSLNLGPWEITFRRLSCWMIFRSPVITCPDGLYW